MHKVVCEEPRHGGGPQKHSRRGNLAYDLLPKKEGMRRPHRSRKWFGEHLGPLRRWLRSQIGRPWDDVYGEACKVIRPDSVVRNHIKVHLLEFVQRNTFMRNGQVWCFAYHGRHREMPVEEAATLWTPFFVHPESGHLFEAPRVPKRRPRYVRLQQKLDQVRRWRSDSELLLLIDGLWFSCQMKAIQPWFEEPFDLVFKLRLDSSHAVEVYGRPCYCVAKRQISHSEMKSFGVANSPRGSSYGIKGVIGEELLGRMRRSNGNPVRKQLRSMAQAVLGSCQRTRVWLQAFSKHSTQTLTQAILCKHVHLEACAGFN